MKQPSMDANAFLHEKLEALIHEFDQVGDNAPSGQVLNNLDAFLFVDGRKFLTEFLQTKNAGADQPFRKIGRSQTVSAL